MPTRSFALAALATLILASPLAAQRLKLPKKLEELEKIARADSNDAFAHYNVAIGYWSEERYEEAEAALRLAARLDPKLAEAHLALAYLPYARRSELWEETQQDRVPEEWRPAIEESDRLYRRAFLVNPLVDLRIVGAVLPPRDHAFFFNDELRRSYDQIFGGFEEFAAGRYEQAYQRIQRLIYDLNWDRHPDRAPEYIFWYRGLAAGHTERWDEAIADAERLLERSKEDVETDSLVLILPLETNEYRYLLAYLHHRAGGLEQAIPLYREALEHDLGLYMAHVRLAEIHETLGQTGEALEERRRAVATNPDDSSLLFDLGLALAKAGQTEEALSALTRARASNPRDPRTHYLLGLVQASLGRSSEARAALERFVELAPNRYEAQVDDAKKRLDALP